MPPLETIENLKIDSDSEKEPAAATFKVTQSSALHLKGFRSQIFMCRCDQASIPQITLHLS